MGPEKEEKKNGTFEKSWQLFGFHVVGCLPLARAAILDKTLLNMFLETAKEEPDVMWTLRSLV